MLSQPRQNWRLYVFKFFDVDAPLLGPGSEKKLRNAWTGLVDVTWHPYQLCQYIFEQAKVEGFWKMILHLGYMIFFWDIFFLQNTAEIHCDKSFYTNDATLANYDSKAVPSPGLRFDLW